MADGDKVSISHNEMPMTPEPTISPLVEEEPAGTYQVRWKTLMAVFALSMANCCAAIANTTNTIIHFQVMDLGDAGMQAWISNANLLVTLAFGPVLGSLSDRFGKKWFIVIASIIGIVGSVVSGSAKSIATIIIGNILTGLANAGCIMGVPAGQEVTPNKLRPWTMGFSQTMASCAVIAGTLGAGAFVKYQTWRWSYYLNAFVYGTTTVLVTCFYHPPPTTLRRQQSRLDDLFAQVDYFGIMLFVGSIASIMIGLTWGGNTYPWSSSQVLASLVIGCVGLLAFGLYERLFTRQGIFHHDMFVSRNFPILLFVCVVDGMLLLGVNVLFSQQIASMFTTDAVKIATILTPYLATSAFGCLPAGILMARTKSYRTILVASLIWCSLFVGLMALLNPSRLSWAYAFSALFGCGTAVTTVIPVVALSLSVPSYLLGTAGTLSVSGRALGGAIGITIFTSIYHNKMGTALPKAVGSVLAAAGHSSLLPDVLSAINSGNPTALKHVSGLPASLIPEVLAANDHANTYSWRFVWIAISVVVAANAVAACFLKSVASQMNSHVESALEDSDVRRKQMRDI
ncbi:Putative MFS-type transporter C16A3.17c [Fusarium oxysporum f. sp. cubense race 1]|uniref:Putative MFS-type transporter C16A3.17c n=1 Tax=Fusarium oxysporum f. sp. cubense (strain race 1) TaxID=1229664 RepID=N4UCG4_FUSC1|nr:Putative MFS-type transporter C16A3.17c [Fusarium oxysporum f. sp. cubense race 1]